MNDGFKQVQLWHVRGVTGEFYTTKLAAEVRARAAFPEDSPDGATPGCISRNSLRRCEMNGYVCFYDRKRVEVRATCARMLRVNVGSNRRASRTC
jgi:hypothetical protein